MKIFSSSRTSKNVLTSDTIFSTRKSKILMRQLIIFCIITLLLSAIGHLCDHSIDSLSTWLKPAKFAVSIFLYAASFNIFQRYITSHKRLIKFAISASVAGGFIELASALAQAALAWSAHSNACVEGALLITGRLAIMPLAFLDLIFFAALMKEKNLPPVMGSAIKWGMLLTAIGFIPGFILLAPEHVQVALSHNAFCSSGNLRIAHFIGIHALQIIPLVALYVERFDSHLSIGEQLNILRISGFSYFGLIQILTWQALRNEMILAPSRESTQVISVWLVSTFVSLAVTLFWSKILKRCWKQTIMKVTTT